MIATRIATLALAASALVLPALAQDGARFRDLDADRLNARQVLIEFDYDGGACEEVGEAQLGATTDGTLVVTLSLVSTAEVCTMQLVDHDIKEAIAAGPDVTHVEVTLLSPDGQVMATGTTEVDED